jgi:probable HAF family extracellular repeat protein
MHPLSRFLIPLASLVLPTGLAFAAPFYTATWLGSLGGAYTLGQAINASGQITGSAENGSGQQRAFFYTNGTMIDAGTLGGTYSVGLGINDSGQITGSANIATGENRLMLYAAGSMTDLGIDATGRAINASGQITGNASAANGWYHAFLYSAGTMIELSLPGEWRGWGYDINDSGQVTGVSIANDNSGRAFLYSAGTMTTLGNLGGGSSTGYAINAKGQITGLSNVADGARHAFLFSDGTMTDLGTLGGKYSEGYGINDFGHVVGHTRNAADEYRAFLFSEGTMHDLNSLVVAGLAAGETLTIAHDVNNNGQIVAYANCKYPVINNPPCRTYRLDPIPVLGMGSAYARNYVQKAYVAYYGRPADPGGQGYWAARMDAEGQSLDAIIGAFGYSDEFNRRYGGLTNRQLVTKIYQQTLGRDPDQAGLDWYVAELVAGRRTLQTITLDVLNGATTAPDSTVVANKLTVAAYYTAKVAAGCSYGTEQDGVDIITIVTALPASVAAAEVAIDAGCGP